MPARCAKAILYALAAARAQRIEHPGVGATSPNAYFVMVGPLEPQRAYHPWLVSAVSMANTLRDHGSSTCVGSLGAKPGSPGSPKVCVRVCVCVCEKISSQNELAYSGNCAHLLRHSFITSRGLQLPSHKESRKIVAISLDV